MDTVTRVPSRPRLFAAWVLARLGRWLVEAGAKVTGWSERLLG